eukprot:GHVT01050498.1.p1 GENE.GHVT01050498.1~~GHVT01050498.1.p1  ORF type:complete len:359 (+),score=56.78 GHVT01050498.1:815-1891(+)
MSLCLSMWSQGDGEAQSMRSEDMSLKAETTVSSNPQELAKPELIAAAVVVEKSAPVSMAKASPPIKAESVRFSSRRTGVSSERLAQAPSPPKPLKKPTKTVAAVAMIVGSCLLFSACLGGGIFHYAKQRKSALELRPVKTLVPTGGAKVEIHVKKPEKEYPVAEPKKVNALPNVRPENRFLNNLEIGPDFLPQMDFLLVIPVEEYYPAYCWEAPLSPVASNDRSIVSKQFSEFPSGPWRMKTGLQRYCVSVFAQAAMLAPELVGNPATSNEWIAVINKTAKVLVKQIGYPGLVRLAKAMYIHKGFSHYSPKHPHAPVHPVDTIKLLSVLRTEGGRDKHSQEFGVKAYHETVKAIRAQK